MITNYTDLQAAITTEMKRSTQTAVIAQVPNWIQRCEQKINRKARILEQESLTEEDYLLAATSRFMDPPTGKLEIIGVQFKKATQADNEYLPVTYIHPNEMWRKTVPGRQQPTWYTIRNQIEFDALPDANYKIRFHMVKMWDIATDGINWLLTNFSDIYFYGSLVEGETFVQNDARVAMWKSRFQEALTEIEELSQRDRDDGELPLDELADLTSYSNHYDYNILRG